MAVKNAYTIRLDVKNPNYTPEPMMKQNDTIEFKCTLFNDGVPILLSDAMYVSIGYERPDGKNIVLLGNITGPNEVTFKTSRPENSLVGRVKTTVQIYNDDVRISTLSFTFVVDRDPSLIVPNDEDKGLIQQVLGEGPKVIADAKAATIAANEAAANANQAATDVGQAVAAANQAATQATNAATNANQSADNANEAADDAAAAATLATDAATAANTASEAVKGWGSVQEWVAGTYNKNNIVARNGSTFQARKDGVTSTPPSPAVTNADWIVMALRGVDGTGSVVTVNGESPDGAGNVQIDAVDVGAYSTNDVDTLFENAAEVLEGAGYNTKSVSNLTETAFRTRATTGHYYVSPDNSGFLPEQETFFATISKYQSNGNTFSLFEIVRLSSGIAYTRAIVETSSTVSADTGWIEGGGGSGGGGIGTTKVNAIKLATTAVDQTTWNIPTGTFDPSTDSILVFHNGVYLPSTSWIIQGVSPDFILGIPDVPANLKGKIENNNVSIAIFRSMPFGDTDTISGTRITPKTIGMDRLEQAVQDMINGGGAEIANNLTTDDPNKVLSAAMGVAIKAMIDAIPTTYFSSSLTLDSETKAATSKAVKQLNDEKLGKAGGILTGDIQIHKTIPKLILTPMTDNQDGTKHLDIYYNAAGANNFGVSIDMDEKPTLQILGQKDVRFVDNNNEWTKLSDLKQSVVDGKTAVAAAITTKGVTTAADATFSTMATNINAIPSGKKYASGNLTAESAENFNYADSAAVGVVSFVNILIDITFQPKVIFVRAVSAGTIYTTIFLRDGDGHYASNTARMTMHNGSALSTQTYNMRGKIFTDTPTKYVVRLPVQASLTYTWEAYGY